MRWSAALVVMGACLGLGRAGYGAVAVNSTFLYQGMLKSGGQPVSGNVALAFTLWDNPGSGSPPTGGNQIGASQAFVSYPVQNGFLVIELNANDQFGPGARTGRPCWLQITVNGVTLSPRQPLQPAMMARAIPGMRAEQGSDEINLIGGTASNYAGPGAYGSVVCGGGRDGYPNRVMSGFGVIGGGTDNRVTNTIGTIGGGSGNEAAGYGSTIPGGRYNYAGGTHCLAAGTSAHVRSAAEAGNSEGDAGTFIWADYNFPAFTSTGMNQFLIRANGGAGIGTNAPEAQLHVAGGTHDTLVIENDNAAPWAIRIHNKAAPTQAGAYVTAAGKLRMTSTTNIPIYAELGNTGFWTAVSDGRLKQDVQELSGVLTKVLQLRPVSFRFKSQVAQQGDAAPRPIGFIAQDVQKLFPSLVEGDPDSLTLNYSGMGVLAIQAVRELADRHTRAIAAIKAQQEHELAERDVRLAAQQKRIDELATRLTELEARINGHPASVVSAGGPGSAAPR